MLLLDRKLRVAFLEIACAIAHDTVAQSEILRASRSADGVSLDEPKPLDRPRQGGRREQAATDRGATQVRQSERGQLRHPSSQVIASLGSLNTHTFTPRSSR
jgi:hypothetical protein